MNAGGIYISEVIRHYNASGMSSMAGEFSLKYVYLDAAGKPVRREYARVRRRIAKTYDKTKVVKDYSGIVREERDANKLHVEFWDGHSWVERKLFIAQVVRFNGLKINHSF